MRKTGVHGGIGCMTIFPAAIIGFAGLTDGIGPRGWRGLAELLGWFTTCLIVTGLLAVLLARGRRTGASAYSVALAAVAIAGMLAYRLVSWIGIGAPGTVKILFTSSMQAFGTFGMVLCLPLVVNACWTRRQR